MEKTINDFYKWCGIDDPMQHYVTKVEVENDNSICVTVFYSNADYSDEFVFHPGSSMYDFVKDYYHFNFLG